MNTLIQLFEWLIAASLRASLLTAATLLLQAALRRHLSASMRYALWLPVLIVLLMPVLPQSQWSIEHVLQTPSQPVQISPAPIAPTMETVPAVSEAAVPMPEPFNWQRMVLITWTCVSAALLILGSLSFLLTLRRFKQTRHPVSDELLATLAQIAREMHLRHVPRVLIASTISSPAVTGLLRPTLLLPAQFDHEFTPAEARLVLKHELMHLKRGDLPLNALMCVLMTLHWFNPLLWIAFFKIRNDREAACDAQVLRHATQDHRAEYGHALLKVETAFCPRGLSLGFVGIFQRGSALRSRIQSIATHRPPHPAMKAMLTVCIVLMTFFGITRAQQPKPDETAPLIAIEIKIVKFKEATDWNFGGGLPAEENPSFPTLSILSPTDLATYLRELIKKDATVISYPRMVAANEKEVVIKSIVNQPFKGEDGKLANLPIGVVCKLTPAVNGERVKLDIDITDSYIIDPATGAAISDFTGEYPTVRSRVYKASHATSDGLSQVIAGWDDDKPQSKRPVLYIITPHVIDPKKGGLPANVNLASVARTNGDSVTAAISPHKKSAFLGELVITAQETSTDPRTKIQTAKGDARCQVGGLSIHAAELVCDPKAYQLKILGPFTIIMGGSTTHSTTSSKSSALLDLASGKLTTAGEHTTEIITAAPSASKIVIPSIAFRDATLAECLDFIRIKAREFDPDKKGVNIVLKPGGDASARVTLSLKNVPVAEALRYCAELANHTITFDAESFFLAPVSAEVPADKKDQAATPAAQREARAAT